MSKTKRKGLGKGGLSSPQEPNQPYQPYPYLTNREGFTLKEKIQYSLLSVIVAGGAIIIGRKFVKKAVSVKEQQNTLEDGSIATYAKQVKMAFDNDGWWGTNVGALRDVLRQIPDKSSFNKVLKSYQRLYNSPMLGDMQKALKSTEYNEMLAIVSAKPDHKDRDSNQAITLTVTTKQLQEWSKRLKAAFDITYGIFPGTDTEAIKAVFLEVPTQDAFERLKTTYQSMYGNELLSDLKSELHFWEYDPMMKIIYDKQNS